MMFKIIYNIVPLFFIEQGYFAVLKRFFLFAYLSAGKINTVEVR